MTIVAIDGPTGVGKSTTALALAAELGADLLLDPVSVSPLLDDYYSGEATPAAALDSELAFLRSRAHLFATASPDRLVVSDFSVMRTAPFAEFLADDTQRRIVLDELDAAIRHGPRPDVLVLLRAPARSLLERVRTRARGAEVDLNEEHLDVLTDHFATWHDAMASQATTLLEIDTSRWDPRRPEDLSRLVDQIRAATRPASSRSGETT